jgi:hypothetical protein
MWFAYGDESGHSSHPGFFSIGMWVGPEGAWDRFDRAWRMILNTFGIPYMHMREYAHSIGPFKGWDEEQRRQLMTAVLLVLEKAAVFPLVAALSVNDYRRLTQTHQSRLRDPFFACLQETIRGCGLFLLDEPGADKVRIIYSQQDEFQGDARKLFNAMVKSVDVRNNLDSFQFEPMKKFPGLQAADLLAYESFRYCQMVQRDPAAKLRFPFQRILDMQPRGNWMFKYLPYWYLRLQAAGRWKPEGLGIMEECFGQGIPLQSYRLVPTHQESPFPDSFIDLEMVRQRGSADRRLGQLTEGAQN